LKNRNYKIKNFKLNTSKNEFTKSIKKIKSYIEEGDTYQVNYTVKGKFNFKGSYSGLFRNLVFNQSAHFIAVINNSNKIIISLSPELFFEIKGRKIISKPMKGTARRGVDLSSDSLIKYQLETGEKIVLRM
jgi:para-aminobenzoate synthetase/4-amino-4-deoxychorismate lyase